MDRPVESDNLWSYARAEDPAARVTGVNRGLEGLARDGFNRLVNIARKIGDPVLGRSVPFVLADETTHVRMGSNWLTRLTEGDPERRLGRFTDEEIERLIKTTQRSQAY